MQKKWVRFISFCTLLFLLFTLGNLAFQQTSLAWTDFYRLPKNSVDVVFLGNSHSSVTFQPQIIDALLPIQSVTLGVLGENVAITYYELCELLKHQNPKIVVLETFTINLTDLYVPTSFFFFTDSQPFDRYKAAVDAKFLNAATMHTFFPLLRVPLDWNDPDSIYQKIISNLSPKSTELNLNPGYISNYSVMTRDNYMTALKKSDIKNDLSLDENMVYLQKIVDLCKKNDIQLVLATVPVVSISEKEFIYYEPFDAEKYAMDNQIGFINFDTSKFNEMQFANADHLSVFGSIDISIQTALDLSQRLNLAIDQQQLENFSSLKFSDYSLIHNGNKAVIELNPDIENPSLDYCYAIREIGTNAFLNSSGWLKQNRYEFSVPAGKGYEISVLIRNQKADYSISAVFSLDT